MTGRQLGSKASLVVMAVLLAAVSGQASAKVTVNYWDKWGGMDADFIKSMVSKFNKSQNRIEVDNMIEGPAGPYHEIVGYAISETAQSHT